MDLTKKQYSRASLKLSRTSLIVCESVIYEALTFSAQTEYLRWRQKKRCPEKRAPLLGLDFNVYNQKGLFAGNHMEEFGIYHYG